MASDNDAGTPTSTDRIPTRSASRSRLAARKARRYAFACASCKSRKVKCSGDQPTCKACQRNGEPCVWPSQGTAESRLRNANARIRELEASLQSAPHPSQGLDTNDTQENQTSPQQARIQAPQVTGPSPNLTDVTSPGDGTQPPATTELWFQVGIGEDGAVVYNGPTSRFHAGALEDTNGSNAEQVVGNQTPSLSGVKRTAQIETLRSQYSLMDSVWMPLIESRPTIGGTNVDTKVGVALLEIYWTWLHPLHNCVYRPSLIMDLALGGPYCSTFLLMCIFALAARHLPEDNEAFPDVGKGERYVTRAKELLLTEMAATKPSIPSIQGLLILGGRQCAAGKSSEGWLYTGMAIRMMIDIGLHLDTPRLAELQRWTPAETETRKRLYNSAYIWDKTLSLALGRPPSLIRRPYPSSEILDNFDDHRSWKPVHAVEVGDAYRPSPAWNSSTFCAFWRLHELTSEMLLLFSTNPRTGNFAAQINNLDARFRLWHDETEEALRIDDPASLAQSPPPHIVSLNLLYHVLHILLRRPYLNSYDPALRAQSTSLCIMHSKKIHDIHHLYARTFPYRMMTYQISYCIYTAATVEAQMLRTATNQTDRAEAAARLAYAVKVLQDEASHTPGSGRSLDTIRRVLNAGGPQTPSASDARVAEASLSARQTRRSTRTDHEISDARAGRQEQELSSTVQVSGRETMDLPNESAAPFSGDDLSACLLPNELNWGDAFNLSVLDTGAGFHPDACSWALADNYPKTPNLGSHGEHGGMYFNGVQQWDDPFNRTMAWG